MVRIAREAGARIIGPNCVGIYCPASKLPFPLGPSMDAGSVGVVSQSGFFADYLALIATGSGVRFSKGISCGNESDLNATDFLEYLGEDPETEIIVSYVEGMSDGRRFFNVASAISKRKPIILWKGGITEAGARAAISHTGALAGSRPVWEGVLRQAGIVSVGSFEEALDCLYAFHHQPLPRGNRIAIISGPGGIAVGTADRCLDLGLKVAQFSQNTVERLRKAMPPVGGSINNPIDLSLAALVSPRVYRDAIRIVTEENVDMLIVITVARGEEFRDLILEAAGDIETRKPLAIAAMSGTTQSVAQDFPLYLGRGIPIYYDAARAAKALARLAEYARFRARRLDTDQVTRKSQTEVKAERTVEGTVEGMVGGSVGRIDVIETALREGRTLLSEYESKEVLRAYAIPVTRERVACSEREFKEALKEIGFPLVIKACGPMVSHKTERGLVHTDVRNQKEAVALFKRIMSAAKRDGLSVLVQEMVNGSRELVVGFTRDAQFGPCVMFGLGGVFTEVLRDVAFRVAPVERSDVLEMMNDIKSRGILDAFRGMPAADMDQLADIVIKVGNLGIEQSNIKEIDINPIILAESGPVAVDALIVLNLLGPQGKANEHVDKCSKT